MRDLDEDMDEDVIHVDDLEEARQKRIKKRKQLLMLKEMKKIIRR